MADSITRREFLQKGAATVAGVAGIGAASLAGSTPERKTALPTRGLGNTGERVSILGLGGESLLRQYAKAYDAQALISRAIDLGITYCDSARIYGPSEVYYGPVIKYRRDQVFLTTKVMERTYDGAKRSIQESLSRLQTDHVDLLQVHNVRDAHDVERITAKDGMLKALVQAREQGMARHLGVTGHYEPQSLMEMIRRFDFETILVPLNAADEHFLSFQEELLPLARSKGMGIVTMKVAARGRLVGTQAFPKMEPLLRFALSLPVHVAIVGMDSIEQLEDNVATVRSFQPLTGEEKAAILRRSKPMALEGTFFKRGSAGWGDD
jgi:aryl-alcohol dehydrogenase-like predicted oxidoreductase